MLNIRIVNSDFTVNDFDEIGEKEFVPGESTTLAFRLYNSERDVRFVPGSSAIVTVQLGKSDGTTLEIIATKNADDRSLCSVAITASQSALLTGGNVVAEVDTLGDGAVIRTAFAYSALRKVITT